MSVRVVIGCTKMIAAREDQTDKEGYWISELMLLAIEPRRKNELHDINKLEALANNTKQVYYQYYKTAYIVSMISKRKIDLISDLGVYLIRDFAFWKLNHSVEVTISLLKMVTSKMI
jgi:hypothetical protein